QQAGDTTLGDSKAQLLEPALHVDGAITPLACHLYVDARSCEQGSVLRKECGAIGGGRPWVRAVPHVFTVDHGRDATTTCPFHRRRTTAGQAPLAVGGLDPGPTGAPVGSHPATYAAGVGLSSSPPSPGSSRVDDDVPPSEVTSRRPACSTRTR